MAHNPVLAAPQILGRGPIIPSFKPRYVLVPSSLPGSWGSFTQALGLSQDLGYALGTSGSASPSIGPFAGNNDDDDADTDPYLRGDDSS